ncbi:hypothetical protein, partial [Brevundimonas sp. ZS04]|uniref:hypothetical protein n=1 Tax=Brevundimonas sp. ZS04 TaxID=1906854 RepID=UPI00097AE585
KADAPHGEPGIPELLNNSNAFDCADAATADGFYRAPCIPVTLPGGTETWRYTVTNSGTLPMDRVVSIDNLPTPGDQGLIVTLPRQSEWEPTLVSEALLSGAPDGTTITTYTSPQDVPCIADLNPLGGQCAPGSWT